MKIGDREIVNCNDCPAYAWQGESSKGDSGCCCDFGAFEGFKGGGKKPVPDDCPLRWNLNVKWMGAVNSAWHREFVNAVKDETGCSSESAGMVLGRAIELVMCADREGYIRGYNNGDADAKEKLK